MNTFVTSARSPGQAAYYRVLNRFIWALVVWTTAWLIVLCLKGAVLLYDAPASVSRLASWLSWVTYPPAALEVLVCAILLAVFRPHEGDDRVVHYVAPERIQRARWVLYGIFIAPVPLAVAWLA